MAENQKVCVDFLAKLGSLSNWPAPLILREFCEEADSRLEILFVVT
jgi:hypothetical protein